MTAAVRSAPAASNASACSDASDPLSVSAASVTSASCAKIIKLQPKLLKHILLKKSATLKQFDHNDLFPGTFFYHYDCTCMNCSHENPERFCVIQKPIQLLHEYKYNNNFCLYVYFRYLKHLFYYCCS